MTTAPARLSRLPIAAALAIILAAPALAGPAFLKLGSVQGESTDDRHREEIEVESFSWGERGAVAPTVTLKRGVAIPVIPFNHEVKSPRDVASGQAIGKRQHHPIRLREGSLDVVIPPGTCVPGTRYPMVTLQSDTHVYELQDVKVASCTPVEAAKGRKDKAKLDYMIVKMETVLVTGY